MDVDPYNIGIQMKRKELTKTVMMILEWKNPLVAMFFFKLIQRFKGWGLGFQEM